ncbi:hypothetical protein TcasGA2_TC005368 [Tribolium castaneum]|uniref:Deltamethrin resistance protein prag01 domain-containing protein n=1 Tax=Tribolium castaneum TaxID=7070 RepID=D6WUS3_TRICA|nr:PREDICTED: uncharacterized protein LOC103314134 [Tribolium castaneum]XP_008197430.1 PREDICTED: uncharacterized protein LOC103314134 [Tribolium castaneum]EFA07807.1 hypothetical protein TcasGA2_TC005368 [Tribolium castaneum]|eukprot:XP_008197429.1 PREDICTED: uncharacterized protein LOC103314134 [Tribolium castaneum]
MQSVRLFRQIGAKINRRSYASKDVFPPTTMNDLPTPKGDWKTNYERKQRKHNRDLILGVVTLGATLAYGYANGYYDFYNDIPALPDTPPNYRVEN